MTQVGATLGFEVGDTVALSQQLVRVLTSEEKRKQLVRKAREYCASHSIANAIPVYEQTFMQTVFDSRGMTDEMSSSSHRISRRIKSLLGPRI